MDDVLPAPAGRGPAGHRKLKRLLWQVFQDVPAFHSLWRAAGIDPASAQFPDDFGRLPVVGKRELAQFCLSDRCRPGLGRRGVRIERSSGSTGHPFEVALDPATRRRRQRRFFKALVDCGYRPGQRVLLLTAHARSGPARFFNWCYAPITLESAELAAEFCRLQPAVLYGPLNTLLALADELATAGRDWPRPRLVVSTAEDLHPHARRGLTEAYGVEPADFYGLTETGVLAWRAPGAVHYRTAAGEFLFEFLPTAIDPGLERLVVTDLGRALMPLVRFDTGDLAVREQRESGPRIRALAGRELDSLLLPGGKRVSPYRVTLALEQVPGLLRFRVVQERDLSLHVEAWSEASEAAAVSAAVRNCLEALSGRCLPVHVRVVAQSPPGQRKFRPVCSLAAAPP